MVARVAGILLAAGDGTRLGQPKATVQLGGMTLAERGVRLLRDGGADPVLVVTGAVPVQIPGTVAVPNPDWLSGMGSSLAAGLRALAREAPRDGKALAADIGAVVIALADQPLIGPAAVGRLLAAYAGGAAVAVAAYDGKPRNPVLIGRAHWTAVTALATGDPAGPPGAGHPGRVRRRRPTGRHRHAAGPGPPAGRAGPG